MTSEELVKRAKELKARTDGVAQDTVRREAGIYVRLSKPQCQWASEILAHYLQLTESGLKETDAK
jgi:hypothetical protein